MKQNYLDCPNCGRRYTSLDQFTNVYQLGLALKGECTKCGTRFGVNVLWRKTEERSYKSPEAERARTFRSRKRTGVKM